MQFGSSYIPPRDFDYFHWLEPQRKPWAPVWFYWVRRSTPHSGSFVDISTVDEYLQPIVEFVQSKDITTYPSCQGHFPSLGLVHDQAHWLRSEEKDVQDGNLIVRDVETDQVFRLSDPEYQASSANTLLRDSLENRGVGRIAFHLPSARWASRLGTALGAHGRTLVRDRKADFLVRGKSEEDLRGKWHAVHGAVCSIL